MYNKDMHSLLDIMSAKDFEEPVEILTVKEFVKRHFDSDVGVTMLERQIIINTPSSALAGSLRMKLYELQDLLGAERRLVIRIGQ
jgi:hypothetical protein